MRETTLDSRSKSCRYGITAAGKGSSSVCVLPPNEKGPPFGEYLGACRISDRECASVIASFADVDGTDPPVAVYRDRRS